MLNYISNINSLEKDESTNSNVKDITETFSICFTNLAKKSANKFLIF